MPQQDSLDGNTGTRRRIAILGCTGSIGQQTLDVIRAFPQHFQVIALVAHTNIRVLADQYREFQPRIVGCTTQDPLLQQQASDLFPHVICGTDALLASSTHPEVDIVVVALSGLNGVQPTLAALRARKKVALANKETLILAGHLVMSEARRQKLEILPIDSEHSAIWQCLQGEVHSEVRQLYLTASGGPFRHFSTEALLSVQARQALTHPTWQMGEKITIDSATLMNKGLEVIEAHWLFDLSYEQISVVVHPQSIIHSMVEFVDDSIKMQASLPSMHLPIQYALSYPQRLDRQYTSLQKELHWPTIACLDFEEVNEERFPCLRLAYEAGKLGGSAPALLAGADEQAVQLFLQGRISFPAIPVLIETVLARHTVIPDPDLETLVHLSYQAQQEVLYFSRVQSRTFVPHIPNESIKIL